MLIDFTQIEKIYIVCGKTDLRKGIDGLAEMIQSQFKMDPFDSAVFFFCGSRRDRFKALYWDGDGFYLLYKRLENGYFQWPRSPQEVLSLTSEQITLLLTGFNPIPTISKAIPTTIA